MAPCWYENKRKNTYKDTASIYGTYIYIYLYRHTHHQSIWRLNLQVTCHITHFYPFFLAAQFTVALPDLPPKKMVETHERSSEKLQILNKTSCSVWNGYFCFLFGIWIIDFGALKIDLAVFFPPRSKVWSSSVEPTKLEAHHRGDGQHDHPTWRKVGETWDLDMDSPWFTNFAYKLSNYINLKF